ncbi:MAG: FHA domain-containing protein [Lachnospiraceae bacterium]|nr:FHA domain-containing protein [Lachnospiraceae bacterium]
MKKSNFRIILMIAGLLHVLVFFAVPYAKLSGVMSGLGQLAGALGMGDSYPEKLTGMAAMKMADMFRGDAGAIKVLFPLPAVLGALILLANAIGKGKASYIVSLILSLVGLGGYGFLTVAMQDFESVGYKSGALIYIMLAVCAVQFVVSIVGMAKDKAPAAGTAPAAGSKGKNVKVGKKDGTITGVTGAYSGAVIPVKSGDTIVIGRDPSSCSIIIKDEKASRKHCTVSFNAENGMYAVTDLSVNGVYDRDGGRLPEKTAVPMSAGSEIRIGKDGDVFRLG